MGGGLDPPSGSAHGTGQCSFENFRGSGPVLQKKFYTYVILQVGGGVLDPLWIRAWHGPMYTLIYRKKHLMVCIDFCTFVVPLKAGTGGFWASVRHLQRFLEMRSGGQSSHA